MLELLVNPKKAERKPWEMFVIGLVYATLSVLIAKLVFGNDPVLSKYMGIFIIIFCVVFSMPFIYYTIKLEERKDLEEDDEGKLLKEHSKAIWAFLWLFMGFIVAFSIWYMVLPNGGSLFKAQIETFCQINNPSNFQDCLNQYLPSNSGLITGGAADSLYGQRLISIFSNNVYVLIFTLIFSLLFGAGAIFILAWNATVIAAAIGIFLKSDVSGLGFGILRYMIHGLPEIAAYFIAALGGGILSIAVIRHDTKSEKFWSIVQDSLALILIALVILAISAIIEVFITPKLF